MISRENIEIKISDLKPFKNNARTHSKEQIELIAASIKEFGFTNPVLIDSDNGIIAGHGRMVAATSLGMGAVPAVRLCGLTEAQRRALVLADNKIAITGSGWDEDLLKLELAGIAAMGFNMDLTGFSGLEIGKISGLGKTAAGDDEIPDAPQVPITALGDQFDLGEHRLRCGDSTSTADVDALILDQKVDLVFTDPPYGVSIGSKNKMLSEFRKGGIEENIKNDTLSPEQLYPLLLAAMKNAHRVMNDCAAIYVCSPQGGGLGMMMMMMKDAGLEVRHVLNWVKNNATFSMNRLDYDYQHEPILFTWKKTHKKIMGGEHKTSCWFIDKPKESKLHPTMKPVEIPVNAILNSSESGDVVLDLFGGAGSTLIACEKTNRKARLMELDPHYCDVIIKRWQDFTGKKAFNIITGLAWGETA
jgi:DNA modification methylase